MNIVPLLLATRTLSTGGAPPRPADDIMAILAKGSQSSWIGGVGASFWQDTAATTAADTAAQQVARADDRATAGGTENATQASSTLRPKLYFDGTPPLLRFDSADDAMAQTIAPGGTEPFTLIVDAKLTNDATLQFMIGARDGLTSTRAYFGFDATNRLVAYIGSDNFSEMPVDRLNARGFYALTWDGADAVMSVDGSSVASLTPSLTPGTSVPFMWGTTSYEAGVSAGSFYFGGDLYNGMIIKNYAATLSELSAINNAIQAMET